MSKYRIGIIAEGPTDISIIQGINVKREAVIKK